MSKILAILGFLSLAVYTAPNASQPTITTSARLSLIHGDESPTARLECGAWRGPANDQIRDCTWTR